MWLFYSHTTIVCALSVFVGMQPSCRLYPILFPCLGHTYGSSPAYLFKNFIANLTKPRWGCRHLNHDAFILGLLWHTCGMCTWYFYGETKLYFQDCFMIKNWLDLDVELTDQ